MHEKRGVVDGENDTPTKTAQDLDPRRPVGTDLMSRMAWQATAQPTRPGGAPATEALDEKDR